MSKTLHGRLIGALSLIFIGLGVLTAPAAAGPARAAAPPVSTFDGQWIIDATTSSFFCPVKSKRLVAIVQDGRVAKLSGLPGTASGQVGRNGEVAIDLRVLGVTATVRGKLIGAAGAGDWSANSMICGRGDWRAQAGN